MIKSKLSIKLLWYVTPLVIIPLLFLGGFTLSNVTQSTEKQADIIVSRFVQQQQQNIFNYTEVFHSATELLSNSPVLSQFIESSSETTSIEPTQIGALLDVFASYTDAYPDILSIDLITPQEKSLAFYSSDLFAESKQYAFTKTFKKNNFSRMQFMQQSKNGITSIYFVKPIFKSQFHLESPKLLAYLILHLDPSVINASILDAPFENTLNLIINNEGKVLFSSDFSKRGIFLTEYELKNVKLAAKGEQLIPLKISSIDQKSRMLYAIHMNDGSYYISSIPRNILYESGNAISLITALIVLISVVLLPILIFIVVKSLLLTPLALLGKASQRVGDGDLKVRLPIVSKDEMGTLFHDFNHMVNQIRHYQGQLEDYKEHLEDKVHARTEALAKMNHQLEQAIDQAKQANQLKSRFLANMSHEIRTPLTAIIGFTEQMLFKEVPDVKDSHLNTVLRNSKHLLELINNILDLSKIEAEKLEIEQQKCELAQLVEDINSVIKVLADGKNLEFKINYHYPLPHSINSDITRLKQVLLNICTNAVKFTEQGYVNLSILYIPQIEQLKFIITDSGIGMSKNELQRIFKPFEQADSSTTRRFGGTGLGLCISKNLANLLGGDVEVSSEKGIGSRFSLTIATNNQGKEFKLLESNVDLNPVKEIKQKIESAHYDARILVAEDNLDNQELIRLLLEHWGLNPEFANNGSEAVEMALTNDYDLILMDMQMPIMGGQEATQMLRHTAYDGPIIALTANVMKHDVDTYIEAGCNEALAKPIDKKELEFTLEKYLSLQKISNQKWEEILANDEFTKLNETYKNKLPGLITELEKFNQKQDWQELKDLSHNIKGSSGCFGFMAISQAAAALETDLTQKEYTNVQSSFKKLIHSINQSA
ncbi:hybrid sensor histidine kinase/response regulator [Pseudoalteromonas denitrificans]|uniref:histidine kinase n=1 Tax=Pseudoalteromonas denitrificans DSM 6059 TaxID=1123010 RepID=A0A1I1LS54_9GAMM|nr:hybrid sensor histidine kinase/response regulator [Pseudoalteromonas denitrificans]SFC75921.1 Signal transduction histidine kinase [Pseudoalteromonas denitrificans DSM 6059]